MININIKPNFKAEYSFDTEDEHKLVKDYLTISYSDRVWDWKLKKTIFATVTEEFFTETKKVKFRTTKTMSKLVVKYLESIGQDVNTDYVLPEHLVLSDKWRTIFENHPKPEKGQLQLKAISALHEDNTGIASLYTGLGKTELLLSKAESYIEQFPTGNVAIITYSNKVLEEIALRAEKYGVVLDGRIKLINPVGYARSSYSKSPEAIEWLSNVNMIIADEAHHFSALNGKWAEFVYAANPDYIFGFTATADVAEGTTLNWESILDNPTSQTMSLMSFCGEMVIDEELPVPIKLTRVHTDLTDFNEYEKFKEDNPTRLQFLISLFLNHEKTPNLLAKIVRAYVPDDSICFIPELTSVDTGVKLCNALNALGIPTVYYCGAGVWTPAGQLDKITLEDLKELARGRHFKVLISNSVGVEGLDIPGLSSIIAMTGKSYKNTIQPLGRSARADLIHCILLFDKYNKQLNAQSKDKYLTIKNRLKVVLDTKVYIQERDL